MINFIFIYLLVIFVLISPSLMNYRIPPEPGRKDSKPGGKMISDREFRKKSGDRRKIQYG